MLDAPCPTIGVRVAATRRVVLVGFGSGLLLGADSAAAVTLTPDDWALGRPKAPVDLVLYASPTSRFCAEWFVEIFPQIQRLYIATGRVRLVLMELLTPPESLAIDCLLLCRAARQSDYFPMLISILAVIANCCRWTTMAARARCSRTWEGGTV